MIPQAAATREQVQEEGREGQDQRAESACEEQATQTAVVEGIGRTGRLVTSAALIMGLAWVALSASPGTEVKIFATALAAGILLDATIVRGVLVPAVVSIVGRWNWWLPHRPARVLRVEPSPVRRAQGT